MPIPQPREGEDHDTFADRCAADPVMNEEYPDESQRVAVCENQWDEKESESDTGDGKQWLRAKATGKPVGVDREAGHLMKDGRHAGVIHGVVIAQEGDFKSDGRGTFDKDALKEIIRLAKAAPNGLKSRFTHPDVSNDGLGKFLGRMRSPWMDKITERDSEGTLKTDEVSAVRADLWLDPTSRETPPGGGGKPYGDYVLDLAESDSDAFSSSLVLRADQEYRIDKKGRQLTDEAGNPLPPLWRPVRLHASDLVDTGDAVDGALSADLGFDSLPDGVVRKAAELLDRQFASKPREFIRERCGAWLERYLTRRFGPEPHNEAPPPAEAAVEYDPAADATKAILRRRLKGWEANK